MNGQKLLIEMRLKGNKPDTVFIDTDAQGWADIATGWANDTPAKCQLQSDGCERIDRLDLRCVVGLTVYVDGLQKTRVHAMRDACIEAGAKRVIATTLEKLGSGEHIAFRTVETTDTAGFLTYPLIEIMELT